MRTTMLPLFCARSTMMPSNTLHLINNQIYSSGWKATSMIHLIFQHESKRKTSRSLAAVGKNNKVS